MTSPVAVVGLVWDGHDLQRPDLDVFFEITEGLDDLPEFRGEDQLIPFRAGRLPGLRLPHRRPIVATGHVMGPADATAKAAFRGYVDELKGWLDPTAGERGLVARFEDSSTRWINCAARNIMPGEGWASEYRAFSIEWEAVNSPFWRADWGEWMLDSGLFLDDGWRFDEGAEFVIIPTSDPHDATFTALGTTDTTDVVLEIDGPSTGAVNIGNWRTPASGLVNTGFSHPALSAGETLVVDTGNRTVLLDGVQARGDLTLHSANQHGEYIRLCARENVLHIVGQPAEVRIRFKRTYL